MIVIPADAFWVGSADLSPQAASNPPASTAKSARANRLEAFMVPPLTPNQLNWPEM
jgi:hypothetical protein